MSKQTITRKAAENTYFHRDFHIALNYGIEYLRRKFGEAAVREYLNQFADAYYAPLKRSLKEKGLCALKEHYEKIYQREGAEYDITFTQNELIIHLFASPAVMHIKANGHRVSPLYHETVITVNRTICKDTPFACEVTGYAHENGAYCLRFFKRKK